MKGEPVRHFFSDRKNAKVIGFCWGLAEGIFFFLVPDVYISFATLFSKRTGLLAWIYSILGSLVSVAVVYILVSYAQASYISFLAYVPGISTGLISHAEQLIATRGLPYTPLLVLGGIPLKVYTTTALSAGISFSSVLVWALFARVVRIGPTFLLFILIRSIFRKHIDAHPLGWTIVLGLSWVVFYTWYFIAIGRTY